MKNEKWKCKRKLKNENEKWKSKWGMNKFWNTVAVLCALYQALQNIIPNSSLSIIHNLHIDIWHFRQLAEL
jgi:hypothetical protein